MVFDIRTIISVAVALLIGYQGFKLLGEKNSKKNSKSGDSSKNNSGE